MMLRKCAFCIGAWCMLAMLCFSCKTVPKPVKNSLAYFNTYYNANRLMVATEDEFFFFDEKQRTKPRIIILEEPTLPDDAPDVYQAPKFVQGLVISKDKLAPVQVRVDSIIIKGSKILARHAETDYVDATLFLMAKAYFYKSEWFQAQVKCRELMDNYPYSVLSPDAHLLLAKTLLLQAKFTQADNALLKAIDIAWGQHRYDALSEAFRIQAEVALHFGNFDDAVKPYRRAITQADDITQQSRWQLEIGLLYYRQKKFTEAIKELQKVLDFAPDALTRYEAELYTAAANAQLHGMEKARPLFDNILANRAAAEWRAFAYSELINSMRINNIGQGIDSLYAIADTLASFAPEAIAAARYQGGVGLIKQREFQGATTYFSKAQVESMPAYFYAAKYLQFLSELQPLQAEALDRLRFYTKVQEDSATFFHPTHLQERQRGAFAMYRTGRIFERLGVQDSALHYYQAAAWLAPPDDTNRARYLYSEASVLGMDKRSLKPTQGVSANANIFHIPTERIDSLLTMIAYSYPTTEQGRDARIRLGLTQEALRDTASERMQSGDSYRAIGNYSEAIKQYNAVAEGYPNTRYAPRALYVQGWLYEHTIQNLDSAIRYYTLLTEKYPASQYALDIKPALDAALGAKKLHDSVRAATIRSSTSGTVSSRVANTTISARSPSVSGTNATTSASSATLSQPNISPQRRRQQ